MWRKIHKVKRNFFYMGALLIGIAVIAVALGMNAGKTVNAAKDLIPIFQKAQIYQFTKGSKITVRVFVDFKNLHKKAVQIERAALLISLDGIQIGECDVSNISIPYGTTSMYFDLVMPWSKLGVAAALKVVDWFSTGTLKPPEKCVIEGQIRALGAVIKINKEIPFSSQSN